MANAVVTTTSLQALAYCRRRRAPLQQQQAADTILLQLKARGGQGTRLHGSTTYCHFVNSHQSEQKVCPAQPSRKYLYVHLFQLAFAGCRPVKQAMLWNSKEASWHFLNFFRVAILQVMKLPFEFFDLYRKCWRNSRVYLSLFNCI